MQQTKTPPIVVALGIILIVGSIVQGLQYTDIGRPYKDYYADCPKPRIEYRQPNPPCEAIIQDYGWPITLRQVVWVTQPGTSEVIEGPYSVAPNHGRTERTFKLASWGLIIVGIFIYSYISSGTRMQIVKSKNKKLKKK